jgi:hypothetical protein
MKTQTSKPLQSVEIEDVRTVNKSALLKRNSFYETFELILDEFFPTISLTTSLEKLKEKGFFPCTRTQLELKSLYEMRSFSTNRKGGGYGL